MLMEQKATGGSVITVTGNRSAVVDGCDGIVDYDDEKVIFRTGRLTVCIRGRSLRLMRLTEHSAIIEGVISAMEYSY